MEDKNVKIIKVIIKLFMALLVIGFVFLVIYFFKKNNYSNNSVKEITDVSMENELVIKLFDRMNCIDSSFDLIVGNKNYLGVFYSLDEVTNSSLDDNIKFALALNDSYDLSLEKEDVVYESSKVDEKVKDIFGKNNKIEDKTKTFILSGMTYNYSSNKIIGKSIGVGGPEETNMITKIIDVYEKDDSIFIVNKVMYVYSGISDIKNYSIKYNVLNKYDNIINDDDIIDTKYTNDLEKFNIDDYLDDLYTYKWKFKKEKNGNYVFDYVKLEKEL